MNRAAAADAVSEVDVVVTNGSVPAGTAAEESGVGLGLSEQAPVSTPGARRGRMPVIAVFFLLGAISASWAARIPAIRAPLHLSDQGLGLALLGPAAGAVLTMPAAGAVLVRRTPRAAVHSPPATPKLEGKTAMRPVEPSTREW